MLPAMSSHSLPHAYPREHIPPAAVDILRTYLRECGSALSATEAVDRAIKLWIATESAHAAPIRGYQWKQLFYRRIPICACIAEMFGIPRGWRAMM